jgi:1-acyl-sn-glycerol-3-phosphate acyltransferase
MAGLRNWAVLALRFMKYFAYRVGIGTCPPFLDIRTEVAACLGYVLRWSKRLRVVDAERCPHAGPAVIAGNHQKLDDPFVMWKAVYEGSGHGILSHFMARDDFFDGLKGKLAGRLLKNRFIDLDELTVLLGTLQVCRENVRISQMKPFFTLLREGKCFVMYPTGTRSRSGLFMEYRDGIEEPGGVSFFLAQAQRSKPDVAVPAIPLARTHNPVTKQDALVFGKPQYLEPGAGREKQREFDLALAEVMGQLIEVNVAHLASAIIYLRCLHGLHGALSVTGLESSIREVVNGLQGRYVDPAAREDLPRAVKRTLKFLERRNMVQVIGGEILPNVEAVLATPPSGAKYKEANPVKHLVNQVIHLADVCVAVDNVVLGMLPRTP